MPDNTEMISQKMLDFLREGQHDFNKIHLPFGPLVVVTAFNISTGKWERQVQMYQPIERLTVECDSEVDAVNSAKDAAEELARKGIDFQMRVGRFNDQG